MRLSAGHPIVLSGQISTVYQDPMSSLNPLMTVGRQITEAIAAHEGVGRREARERAITELPESYRDVYVLADVEGLPNAEIADSEFATT